MHSRSQSDSATNSESTNNLGLIPTWSRHLDKFGNVKAVKPAKKILNWRNYRLEYRGAFTGYRRSRAKQNPNIALIKIDGTANKYDTEYFIGKKCAYIYKAKTKKKGTFYRAMWGKIIKRHGNSGTVRAKFKKNLPPNAMYKNIKVMAYPTKPTDTWWTKRPEYYSDFNDTHFSVLVPKDHRTPLKERKQRFFYEKYWKAHLKQ
eukprot:CAMPEP_0197526618 /NCGR_PEP_ID=MMETSP1318-20131121/18477_1 /TAXON_ID=552666 /ORGANISM="Partenskyella glossopodia, Strain RCC365" /LENGTH=203 /DNA_ID=CAMNT_0043080861 /DNA_START=87 /DNA_END=698 /DNA_ORIENTATION=+